MPDQPQVFAQVGRKVNLGNYESMDLSFGISGIPVDCTEEELQHIFAAGTDKIQKAIENMAAEMARRLRDDLGR